MVPRLCREADAKNIKYVRRNNKVRNPVCSHCKFKRAFCWFFRCDVYYEAQYKKTERRFYKNYMEDFDGEDRYTASLMFGGVIAVIVILLMVLSFIKTIGEWMS